ncbi:uncharacterized protein LOC115695204 [Cannabis sativa]|uniref:uncharacterized protein LOC115695204 n=1 Tax=Cannabis sativa TaxID=3483 RepID=UPI0029C9D926|nr:uncharacterized protein LOC115695204 [Cannabis sativa]
MGFRSWHEYNLSLLGKQGWRLLLYQDSLVGRMYKARYFPKCSFLEAELGGNPSFIWRCVFASQKLLRDGDRRRIRSGSATEVLNTPWLLSEASPCVVSNHPTLVNCKVSQLMKPDSRQWDLELIEDLFESRDVELIKQVSLSVNLGSDSWFRTRIQLVFSQSKAPILTYSWSMVVGTHPWSRMLGRCCGRLKPLLREESIFHVLVQCSFAHSCWLRSALGVGHSVATNFFDWFMEVLTVGNMGLVEEAIMVGWAIWKARNDMLWNGKSCSAADVVWMARTTLRQWTSAQSKRLDSVSLASNRTNTREHWSKPAAGQLKINVDGAVFEDTNEVGTGFVAPGCDGY